MYSSRRYSASKLITFHFILQNRQYMARVIKWLLLYDYRLLQLQQNISASLVPVHDGDCYYNTAGSL